MEELGFETDDKKFAKQTARQWGESKLDTPFTRVELHQGVMDSPDLDSDIFNGVRVRELPFWFAFLYIRKTNFIRIELWIK